jgi:orotidine-5'-phosphate decarboxylase
MESQYLRRLAEASSQVEGVSAIKLGLLLGLEDLKRQVGIVKGVDDKLIIIFDLQKAGNDIPSMGPKFAHKLRESGVDAAIIFPFAGPATQEAWTKACMDEGLTVLTGGIMTHPKFLVSEGGYIADYAPEQIFRNAVKFGGTDFVVPGNKINWVTRLKVLLDKELGEGEFDLYAPGFVTQGGVISECGAAAGKFWHGIVGSAVYGKEGKVNSMQEMIVAAEEHTLAIVS